MVVTNLKGATCKFGSPLAAPTHHFIKFDFNDDVMRRETLHAGNYPYVTEDREGKVGEGSVGFEVVTNLKAATCTLGGSPIGHNFTKFDITDAPMRRETLHAGNYPYKTEDLEGKFAEGSLECELVDGTSFPTIDVDSVVLAVSGTGFSFSGAVKLSNLKVNAGAELGSKATISFDFKTVSGTYTLTLTDAAYPSIHAVSVPIEVVGAGFYLSGNVAILNQKFSATSELGSKATVDMDFRTYDGDYAFSEVAA
jgi:hypothetical protein